MSAIKRYKKVALLEVENLATRFETERGVVQAVDGVDLSIDSGEIVGLVGESGSGKSVLAKSIMGLVNNPGVVQADGIRLHGESLLDKSEREMRDIRGGSISMVFQDPMTGLNPTITVGEQIAETIRLHQDVGESVSLSADLKRKILGAAKNKEAWRRAIEMLEAVSIPEAESRATSYPHEFSGGMRQRAMVAMALSCEPDLLIADEPTTALDVTIQAQILDEIHALKNAFDTAILFITHDLAVINETCTRLNVMYAGEIVERGTVAQVFDDPQHPYTEALMNSTPRVEQPEEDLDPIVGNVPSLIDMPNCCYFAPRCPEATDECFELDPEFRSTGSEGQEAACIRRGDDAI
jgi:oligopeptide/dipeptide ABC transporter ATP-binding protein